MEESAIAAFLKEATWHGDLPAAEKLAAVLPYARQHAALAAVLGETECLRELLAKDKTLVFARYPPYDTTALVYACLSKYLRSDLSRSGDCFGCASLLLEAGADPNAGFMTTGAFPEFETALYGAAGVAQHEALTRLLLQYGADPNDVEAVYHSPETHENGAMQALVETGRVTPDHLDLMLVRKADFHDYNGVAWLLQHGANPNGVNEGRWCALHHSIARENHIAIIDLMLDAGGDPGVVLKGKTAAAQAAWFGRGDVLDHMEARHGELPLNAFERLLAMLAKGQQSEFRASVGEHRPALMQAASFLMARHAGIGNTAGLGALLAEGVPVDIPFAEGDGYFEIPRGVRPLHIAAWRNRPEAVTLLLQAGADPLAPDPRGNTPLQWAVRAAVHSYWMERRSTEVAEALLEAGARAQDIHQATGYAAMDELLNRFREKN